MRQALRREPIFYAVSTVLFFGGSLALTDANVPEWAFFAYLIAVWAVLMYLLRSRKR